MLLSVIDKANRPKIGKHIEGLNNTINKFDLSDMSVFIPGQFLISEQCLGLEAWAWKAERNFPFSHGAKFLLERGACNKYIIGLLLRYLPDFEPAMGKIRAKFKTYNEQNFQVWGDGNFISYLKVGYIYDYFVFL